LARRRVSGRIVGDRLRSGAAAAREYAGRDGDDQPDGNGACVAHANDLGRRGIDNGGADGHAELSG